MPIYEFRCSACNHTEEHLQKVNDPNPEECAACKKHGSLEKIVSQTSFQLKGGGWYSDLYGSVKKDSGSSTKTESTPAQASTPAPAAETKKTEPSSSN